MSTKTRKKKDDTPLERILELIDEKVQERGQAVLTEVDASADIARLTSEARRKGATMPQLSERIQRMDKKERALKPVTRQAIDIMLATFEQRRPARTTRASRRRQDAEVAPRGRPRKLSDEDVKAVCEALEAGETQTKLAKQYGVSRASIANVAKARRKPEPAGKLNAEALR